MKHKHKVVNRSTFDAKVDIVTSPNNIKNYSIERDDFTELALVAIKNKPSTIKFIPFDYKDYPLLCEEAIKQDISVFSCIDYRVSNYKKLGMIAISKKPYMVQYVPKDSKYYYYFWELAISCSNKSLRFIDNKREELFPMVIKTIQKDALSISYVDSNISIYSKLCKIASNNKKSLEYMDINKVDKELVFEMLKMKPYRIRYLDSDKEYYLEACKFVLDIDGSLINYIDLLFLHNNLELFINILEKLKETDPNIINNSKVIYLMCINNRKAKEKLQNLYDNIGYSSSRLHYLDLEYEELENRLKAAKKVKYSKNSETIAGTHEYVNENKRLYK